jgi:NAD binding domain of 6-phosphogluconate dehydrogenase
MGESIAENLRRAGCDLRVSNRTRSKAAHLAEKGAFPVTASADVAQSGGRFAREWFSTLNVLLGTRRPVRCLYSLDCHSVNSILP